jgi:ABC-type uncharacterized transport system YnjBCD ATPase subunit
MLSRSYFDLADKNDPKTGVLLSGGQWQRVALARVPRLAPTRLLARTRPRLFRLWPAPPGPFLLASWWC